MPFLIKGKTNWKYILILLILAGIVGGGILSYLKYFEKGIESLTKFPEIKRPQKEVKDETANWKTYRNDEYGFEIKYPPNFIPHFEENYIYFVEEKWEWEIGHRPFIGIDFIETSLTLREWGNEHNKNPGVSGIGEPLPPGEFKKIGEYEVFQFYTQGVSGADDNTLFQLPGNILVNIHRHTSGAGEIPKNIYEKMLSTFKLEEIKIRKIEIDPKEVAEIQKAVDEGHQPWRLDPEMVASSEAFGLGCNKEEVENIQTVHPPKEGRAQYKVICEGKMYIITVIQPIQREFGIWMVSQIEELNINR